MARARASEAGSLSISSGLTASAGRAPARAPARAAKPAAAPLIRPAPPEPLGAAGRPRRADAQPPIAERQEARRAPSPPRRARSACTQRLPPDAHGTGAVVALSPSGDIELGEAEVLIAASVVWLPRAGIDRASPARGRPIGAAGRLTVKFAAFSACSSAPAPCRRRRS